MAKNMKELMKEIEKAAREKAKKSKNKVVEGRVFEDEKCKVCGGTLVGIKNGKVKCQACGWETGTTIEKITTNFK